ncbi:MAG: S8 family serine peptidase [Hyphomicrobiales bacterium]
MRVLTLIFICLAYFFGFLIASNHTGHAQEQPENWLLAPADDLVGRRYILVTIPIDSQNPSRAQINEISGKYGIDIVAEWPISSVAVHCIIFKVGFSKSVSKLMSMMEKDDDIESVQRMNQFKTLSKPAYSDELFKLQTNLSGFDAVSVHQKTTGRDVKIGVIDTGIDFSHPDLSNRGFENKDFVSVGGRKKPPAERHGTAIAGVIAASNTNGKGIVGVAPDAKIISLRACWQNIVLKKGRCSTFSIARALNVAITQKVDIINLSVGGPFDPLLAKIIKTAIEDHAIVVVAAYSADKRTQFPASQPGVIGVSSQKIANDVIVAPSIDVLSTSPGGNYDFFSGASIGTAHVSAIAALMLEMKKNLSPKMISNIMMSANKKHLNDENLNACVVLSKIDDIVC